MSAAVMELSMARAHRAAVARCVLAKAPQWALSIDWDALEAAPEWLAWPPAALALYAQRVGAVWCAPVLSLWIDRARLEALRAAVGDELVHALPGLGHASPLPHSLSTQLHASRARDIAPLLQATGSAVLLASLDNGVWPRVVASVLAPVAAIEMPREQARDLALRAANIGHPAREEQPA